MKNIVLAISMVVVLTTPAYADMFDFPQGSGYKPTPSQLVAQANAIDHKKRVKACSDKRLAMYREVDLHSQQVIDNSQGSSDTGWVNNNAAQLYFRDVREETTREKEDNHKLLSKMNFTMEECDNHLAKYNSRYLCYFRNTMNNTPDLNTKCSDLYKIYTDPYMYYYPYRGEGE